ncbi:MAG TPA: transposase [Fimbriimonadaceae bacterium]|nr:transposase [Fimbriimonadaceae bacterium]
MASTYTNLLVHVVFSTKKRVHKLTDLPDLHAYIGGTIKRHGAVPIAVGGVTDHVHILASLKATTCVAGLVRETKKAVSTWCKEQGGPVTWQEGYGAFTVGRYEKEAVIAYINNQEEHHMRESSADELKRILEECGIEYDAQYFE